MGTCIAEALKIGVPENYDGIFPWYLAKVGLSPLFELKFLPKAAADVHCGMSLSVIPVTATESLWLEALAKQCSVSPRAFGREGDFGLFGGGSSPLGNMERWRVCCFAKLRIMCLPLEKFPTVGRGPVVP